MDRVGSTSRGYASTRMRTDAHQQVCGCTPFFKLCGVSLLLNPVNNPFCKTKVALGDLGQAANAERRRSMLLKLSKCFWDQIQLQQLIISSVVEVSVVDSAKGVCFPNFP